MDSKKMKKRRRKMIVIELPDDDRDCYDPREDPYYYIAFNPKVVG